MGDRLTIDSGETYAVESGDTEEWSGATVDGTLDVDGTLKLVDNPDTPEGTTQPGTSPIALPMELNLKGMEMGTAMFLTGMMGVLGGAIAFIRAYAAGILWALSLFTLILSGLMSLGLEVFWSMIAGTVLLLIVGVIVQWTR